MADIMGVKFNDKFVKVVLGANFFNGKRYIGIASSVEGKSFFDADNTDRPLLDPKTGEPLKGKFGKLRYENEITDTLRTFGFSWDGTSGCHLAEFTGKEQVEDLALIAQLWEQVAPGVTKQKATKAAVAVPDKRAELMAKLGKG